MIGSSVLGQHALSHERDPDLNVFLSDKFTFFFYEFLLSGLNNRSVKISDFTTLFPYSKVESDVRIKSTHKTKSLDQIYLYEYLPIDKNDVV